MIYPCTEANKFHFCVMVLLIELFSLVFTSLKKKFPSVSPMQHIGYAHYETFYLLVHSKYCEGTPGDFHIAYKTHELRFWHCVCSSHDINTVLMSRSYII